MADEAVVGEDAAQVEVAVEEMPKRSKASRSNQLAEAQTPASEAPAAPRRRAQNTFRRMRQLLLTDSRCETTQKRRPSH